MTSNYARTDLALEDKERFDAQHVEIAGVEVKEYQCKESDIRVTEVNIVTENGAKTMGKPVGSYRTMELNELHLSDEESMEMVATELAKQLEEIFPIKKEEYTVLVVGLGNRQVTPDALGPYMIERLEITRHVIREFGTFAFGTNMRNMVSAIAPGVMGQTGMESFEIVKGITDMIQPDAVIVVDALAARNTKRLNRTIQITDTGIRPGSGVGNHRNEISKESLGIPVVSIGVPSVVSAEIIICDTMEQFYSGLESHEVYEFMQDLQDFISPSLRNMFVTPKDIDEAMVQLATTIATGLNKFFAKSF